MIPLPWGHHIRDNFLPPNDVETLTKFVANWPKPHLPGHKIYVSLKNFDIYDKTAPDEVEALKAFNIIMPLADKYFSSVYGLTQWRNIKIEYVACSKGYRYKKHHDASSKKVSGVLYFSPTGRPTRLFSSEDKVFRHKWKPNRMFSFYNSKDKIHAYGADEERVTFNITYMVSRPKEKLVNKGAMNDGIIKEIVTDRFRGGSKNEPV
jgi:hypothetical protein